MSETAHSRQPDRQLEAPGTCCIPEVRRVTWIGMVVNLVLAALKFAGGIIGHSQAVVADAVHSLSDCSTDIAILVGVGYWSKPADREHPHGHLKIEALVTLFIGLVLVAVAFGLVGRAVVTVHLPHPEAPGWVAFLAAVLSVVTKEILYRWTRLESRRLRSAALSANAWHHRSDALSSVPAAAAVLGTALNPGLAYLDHIAAALVSFMILQAAWRIVSPSIGILLDKGAPPDILKKVEAISLATEGVRYIHAVRSRYIGHGGIEFDLHVKVDGNLTVREGHDISEQVKRRLIAEVPDIIDAIIHLEPAHPHDDIRAGTRHG